MDFNEKEKAMLFVFGKMHMFIRRAFYPARAAGEEKRPKIRA